MHCSYLIIIIIMMIIIIIIIMPTYHVLSVVSQSRMNPTTQLEWSLALRSSVWSTKWSNCRFGTLQDKKGSGRQELQNSNITLPFSLNVATLQT